MGEDKINIDEFSFNEFLDKSEKLKETPKPDALPAEVRVEDKERKRKINFQEMPADADSILNINHKEMVDKYLQEEQISIPSNQVNSNNYLSLVLSPDLKELELMIRGLEYVKRFNPLLQREEIILRKIPDHPLNEFGVNSIMAELKVYCSPEIKLGRKKEKDYYNSIQHVGHSIVRLVYKNLKNFGMDTQVKQRNAKRFCNAIIEFLDASYSRSVGGRENDLSRATELKIEGSIEPTDLYKNLGKLPQKEQLKN